MIAERLEREADAVVGVYFDAIKAGMRVEVEDGGELILTDHAMRLKGAEALLDRALGKARQSVDVAHSGGLSLEALLSPDPLTPTNSELPEEGE